MDTLYNTDISICSNQNKVVSFLFGTILFLIIVFPNAFREIKLGLLLISTLVSLSGFNLINKKILFFYLLGCTWSVLYIMIGINQAKYPDLSTPQVVVVYIISPLLWIVNCHYLLLNYSIKTIIKYLIIFLVIGCFTVILGIWLFDNGYIHILEYIIENPNKVFTEEGIVAIRFHVYGSFIFIFPAFIQLYSIEKKIIYFLIILLMLVTTIISGRDAVILSIGIGLLFMIFTNKGSKIKYLLIGIIIAVTAFFFLESFGVNVGLTLERFVNKIKEGGQSARVEQFYALTNGINKHIFGAGHGVGVDYIRDYEHPWRYEILPLATIFRTGLIGLLIYAFPFIYSFYKFIKLFRIKENNVYDSAFMAGYISLIIGSFTNPYLESFEFQLFYFFPFVYFFLRKPSDENIIFH